MTRPKATEAKLAAFAEANVYRVCWVCAEAVLERFGGELYGYFSADNPAALAGKSAGGHEFAVVADRWLVDAWVPHVEGLPLPAVIDLMMDEGREIQEMYYGPRGKWTRCDWRARRREMAQMFGLTVADVVKMSRDTGSRLMTALRGDYASAAGKGEGHAG
jgi:hypothetical protein